MVWLVGQGLFRELSENNLTKIHNDRYHTSDANFKLQICTCAQSNALGTIAKFQLEIRKRSTISTIYRFRENILESSQISLIFFQMK